MPQPRKPTTPASPARYRHLIGGEAYGVPHTIGDVIDTGVLTKKGVPDDKLQEWLAAGIIEPIEEDQRVRST